MKYFFILVWIAGCSTSVSSRGNQKYSVKCQKTVADCHDRARALCEDGYMVTNRVRPTSEGSQTTFTLNIACR